MSDDVRWSWDDEDGPARLRRAIDERGHALVTAPGLWAEAERDPWGVARRLWGRGVVLVEAHPIVPVAHGRSFASTQGPTPLHSDSQSHRGVPPRVQVMLCARPAATGGQTLLLDTWTLLQRMAEQEPALWHALTTRVRRIPFVFGDVVGPTVALRGGSVVFTHSPMAVDDEVGRRLAWWIERAPRIELRAEAGDVLVVDNHRMLHGRRAFEDSRRRFLRLLVWTREPAVPPSWVVDAVTAVRERLARMQRRASPEQQEALVGAAGTSSEIEERLQVVLELLRGGSPGVLAQRHGVPEPELHRWRSAVVRGAVEALEGLPSEGEHRSMLERLRRALERKLG
ncbi:TauD/TfdA family dioxygenase [Paraliomyxa miuraensis]|uniref:TauD/TfdA family dioxygenase n=1 Tax=Paraliomyxa miuraensis TaxID=376150 RepID=UPI0022529ADA|nr:TauD/TfdA family dioxygenase [Paraliomyxa miuraensis]MCX4246587.1 TauD/TfdA family dioxygenase [Paraliomyxa miuraensis]